MDFCVHTYARLVTRAAVDDLGTHGPKGRNETHKALVARTLANATPPTPLKCKRKSSHLADAPMVFVKTF